MKTSLLLQLIDFLCRVQVEESKPLLEELRRIQLTALHETGIRHAQIAMLKEAHKHTAKAAEALAETDAADECYGLLKFFTALLAEKAREEQ